MVRLLGYLWCVYWVICGVLIGVYNTFVLLSVCGRIQDPYTFSQHKYIVYPNNGNTCWFYFLNNTHSSILSSTNLVHFSPGPMLHEDPGPCCTRLCFLSYISQLMAEIYRVRRTLNMHAIGLNKVVIQYLTVVVFQLDPVNSLWVINIGLASVCMFKRFSWLQNKRSSTHIPQL